MKKIAYIGFGSLGKQISAFIKERNKDKNLFEIYFDDNLTGTKNNAYPFNNFFDERFADFDFYVCLGYKNLSIKKEIIRKLLEASRSAPSFIHHSSYVHPSATIGKGVIIYPGCIIDQNVTIKDCVILNNSTVISHNCTIGESCFLAPSVTFSGNVTIGCCSFVGSASVVTNDIAIGSNVVIGIGSVVTQSIEDNIHCIGNPLKILSKKIVLK
ncbi:MAG: acetyltransferase [Bacteroidia bacterium]|nr:acetyltransferase [Bacteroidia bacterium]